MSLVNALDIFGAPRLVGQMMLLKLILLALGFWIVYRILKGHGRSIKRNDTPKDMVGEDMVRCVHCGVNLPRSEGIFSHGEFFCTNEHRQLHQK
ncbi:MAG: PP0621 family protein [Sulfuricella sp.]|nr:PP0621 family protein [Sulfuricella sp.]